MKYPALLCLVALSALPDISLRAEEAVETNAVVEKEKSLLTPAQIDELLAPIALYPDPLIALILPAATFPTDIVLAARYLKEGADPDALDEQSWDDSVKALARYPEVVKWMDENLAWTQQVGAAFLVQPAAVMNGTQRLRAAAIAAGNLKDTPEQTVIVEREVVRIVPAQREIIYVPVYDPLWVYRPHTVEVYHPGPLVTFSVGYRTGFWLSHYCDWGVNTVVIINRPHRTVVWQTHPSWSCPPPAIVQVRHHHVWRPSPIRVQAVCRDFERRPVHQVARPRANSFVQREPQRTGSPQGVSHADTGDRRQIRPAVNNFGKRDMTAPSDATIATRRDREGVQAGAPNGISNRSERPVATGNRIQRPQGGQAVSDRGNVAGPVNTAPASPVASPVRPAPGANRIRPWNEAPTTSGKAPTSSPAQRGFDRGDNRGNVPVRTQTNEAPATRAPSVTRPQPSSSSNRPVGTRPNGFSTPSTPRPEASRSQAPRQETSAKPLRQNRTPTASTPSSGMTDPEATGAGARGRR